MELLSFPQAQAWGLSFDLPDRDLRAGFAGPENIKLAFLALANTLRALYPDLQITSQECDGASLSIYCGKSNSNKSKLVLDMGWLPRHASYQLSPDGTNSQHHAAALYHREARIYTPLDSIAQYLVQQRNVLQAFNAAHARELTVAAAMLPCRYILVPLQSPANLYIQRHAQRLFGRELALGADGYRVLGQAIIDYVESFELELPVVFKQEPRDHQTDPAEFQLRKPTNRLLSNRCNVPTHSLLSSEACAGVITIASNVLQESLLWQKPVISLGDFFWPSNHDKPHQTQSPVPQSIDALSTLLVDPAPQPHSEVQLHYLAYLIEHQYQLSDFQNPLIVQDIITSEGTCHPLLVRLKHGQATLGVELAPRYSVVLNEDYFYETAKNKRLWARVLRCLPVAWYKRLQKAFRNGQMRLQALRRRLRV